MSASHSPYHVLPDYPALINHLEQIRPKAIAEMDRVEKAIPRCSNNDARLTAMIHVAQLIDSTNLAFTFISDDLLPLNNDWWGKVKTVSFSTFNDRQKSITINNFTVGYLKVGFVQNLFSIIDSTFRILLRKLDPGAANFSTEDIEAVFRALCKRITAKPSNADELMKLLRLIRNTVHNNGVFFPKNQKDDQVIYKGVTYHFIVGKPVSFVTWEFLIERLEDVLQLLIQVIHHPNIIGITDEIPDPFNIK